MRTPGNIVSDARKIVTTLEIGKATVTKIDTSKCDEAEVVINSDIQQMTQKKNEEKCI